MRSSLKGHTPCRPACVPPRQAAEGVAEIPPLSDSRAGGSVEGGGWRPPLDEGAPRRAAAASAVYGRVSNVSPEMPLAAASAAHGASGAAAHVSRATRDVGGPPRASTKKSRPDARPA